MNRSRVETVRNKKKRKKVGPRTKGARGRGATELQLEREKILRACGWKGKKRKGKSTSASHFKSEMDGGDRKR